MEKSNEVGEKMDLLTLERTTRRLEISRDFFGWVSTVFFLSTLFAIGGLFPEITSILSRSLFPLFLLASGMLLYSGYTSWSIIQGGVLHLARFAWLAILIVVFTFTALRHLNLI